MTNKNIYITKIIVTVLLAVAAGVFGAGVFTGSMQNRICALEQDNTISNPQVLAEKINNLTEMCSEIKIQIEVLNNKITTVETDMKWLKAKNGYRRETALK